MGFNGLVIADDLGAAVAVKDVDPGERGVRFLAAGGDVIINADPQLVEPMSQAIIARAQEDPEFAQAITASAARVLTLKNDLRMLDCED